MQGLEGKFMLTLFHAYLKMLPWKLQNFGLNVYLNVIAIGTVSLWSPNIDKPVIKMLCHGAATRSVAVDMFGMYVLASNIGIVTLCKLIRYITCVCIYNRT